jgi:hypothetical protein
MLGPENKPQGSASPRVLDSMNAKLLAGAFLLALLLAAPAQAAPTHYVTMTDGAQIAVNVKVPEQCKAPAKCPAYFEMSGYESGSDDGKTPIGDINDATGANFRCRPRPARAPPTPRTSTTAT